MFIWQIVTSDTKEFHFHKRDFDSKLWIFMKTNVYKRFDPRVMEREECIGINRGLPTMTLRKPGGFSLQIYRSLTGKRQRYSERIICRRPLMWFLNIWDNFPMDLKYVCQQYFTCFLGFIRYNKTFIACGFRKYENLLFIHPRVSYSTLALPSGNMILLGEYICIFPSPVCN